MKNQTRLDRLYRLRSVVELHKGKRGKPVKLNGVERKWNMHKWDCGTSACALGSYALTPYGRRHFKVRDNGITHRETGEPDQIGGAEHFGISDEEGEWIFMPPEYLSPDVYDVMPIAPTKVIAHIDKIIRKYERGEGDMQREET